MIKDVTIATQAPTPTNAEKMLKLRNIKSKLLHYKYTGKVEEINDEEIPF